jgi:hypothetical protein
VNVVGRNRHWIPGAGGTIVWLYNTALCSHPATLSEDFLCNVRLSTGGFDTRAIVQYSTKLKVLALQLPAEHFANFLKTKIHEGFGARIGRPWRPIGL